MISCEFRQPLTTTLVFLQSILSEALSEQASRLIAIVIYQINMALSFINDISDMKLIESNQFVLKK